MGSDRIDDPTNPSPARRMFDRDATAVAFGISILRIDDDGASVEMTVRPEMCNGLGMIHGGMTFLLADTAMALASNDDAADSALATSAGIDWLAPARVGQVLTATASRVGGGRRSAVWDVVVTTDDGTRIGLFRGRTRKTGIPQPSD
jgi:acyl-CoA thioesterase